jgi:hypothetical protein
VAPDRLRELQRLFHALVIAPEGVEPGLSAMGKSAADLAEVVRGDARLGAVERLDVYANMYFFRILDVLRADYERVLRAVGDARFHNLVTDYLLACPPRSPSLREAGDRFPAFLAAADLPPWLAELGALERARLEVFDDTDAEALTLEDLRALPPERFAELPLGLIPAHRVLTVTHAIGQAWRALDEDPAFAPPAQPGRLLVWRQDRRVYHRALEPGEPISLCDGRPFGALCDHLIAARPAEPIAQLAFALLGRWVEDGLIRKATT